MKKPYINHYDHEGLFVNPQGERKPLTPSETVKSYEGMIDALINIRQQCRSEFALFQVSEIGKEIDEALKNAGVEF